MNLSIEEIIKELFGNPFRQVDLAKAPDTGKLSEFFRKHPFPDDFQTLFYHSDGFVLFEAGDYRISDLDWILTCKYDPKYKIDFRNEFWDIGYFMGYSLVIDETKSNINKYLYVGDSCFFDEYVMLGTMTDFFNGFIASKGEIPFWKTEGVKKYNLGV